MSGLQENLDDYLALRRSFGYSMAQEGKLLGGFVAFCEESGAHTVTCDVAVSWARQPAGAHPATWGRRLSLVRGFARFLATFDSGTQIPSQDLLTTRRQRVVPHIYTNTEIIDLLKAASTLTPPLRASRTGAVIGLLAATGMRPAEVLALDRQDVDLDDLVIHVRTGGKRGKQRLIPLHPTVGQVLLDYASLRDGAAAQPATPAFFCSARGARMGRSELNQVFPKLLTQAGIVNRGGRPRPRPYDLRHAFAVHTLIDWYRMGQDVDHKMPILSTYLGHTDPASTYWYLESVPELMHLVADRLENIQGVGK